MNMNQIIEKGAIHFRNHIKTENSRSAQLNIHCAKNNIDIKGIGSVLLALKDGYIRDSVCKMEGENNRVIVNDHSCLSGNCSIRIIGSNNEVEIAENCKITNCSIFVIGNDNAISLNERVSAVCTSFHMEGNKNRVEIGKETSIHGRESGLIEFVLEEGTAIIIGEDCMISNGVSFRSSDSHSILNEKGERINPAGSILISDHVWIGMRSIVLKNTKFHNNCIVGAGSVCNKDYKKENCVIAGNPAKIVNEDMNWSRDRL